MPSSVPAEVPGAPAVPDLALPRRSGLSLMVSELRVLFGRRRTWALLLALAAAPGHCCWRSPPSPS
ncbi:hypothetical protein [Pseudarthrobacter enclensis]|uniref:hypothetical protein n=1 Tax=Pseudarthrobacter enclensis TaxID=993070 RepID=UPI003F4E3690